MRSDEELRKKFKVEVNDNVISTSVISQADDEQGSLRMMELSTQDVRKILSDNPGKTYHMLVVISTAGSVQGYSRKERKLNEDLIQNKQVDKVAICGYGTLLEVMVNLMSSVTGKGGKVKWFKDKEKAFEWLKEK
jgi:hypothetical protein